MTASSQPSLFDAPRSERRGPYGGRPPAQRTSATSLAAAERMRPHAPTQREIVLLYVRSTGATGATRAEIARAACIPINAVCGRVAELLHREDGRLVRTGRRRDGGEVLAAEGRTFDHRNFERCK